MITVQEIKYWYTLPHDEQINYYIDLVGTSMTRMEEWHEAFKLYNPHSKKYVYLVTFTKKDETDDSIIEKYIINQFKRKPLKITEAHIVKELTKKGKSHWHVAVETEKPLKKDRFNYYIKKYGLIDISKNREQNIQTTLNYISKDNLPTKII